MLLEGESLGRWSLYDVHATRLLSSAFSLSLGNEEITFIADEPVDFAYRGVEHMAGVWATFKAMSLPRRTVAVGRSRRGTSQSRIEDLRQAMLQNLQAIEDVPAPEPWSDAPPAKSETTVERRISQRAAEPMYRPAGADKVDSVASPPEIASRPTTPDDGAEETGRPTAPDTDEDAGRSSSLRPGPGLLRSGASRPVDTPPDVAKRVEPVSVPTDDGPTEDDYRVEEVHVPIETGEVVGEPRSDEEAAEPVPPPTEPEPEAKPEPEPEPKPEPEPEPEPESKPEQVVVDLGRYEDRGYDEDENPPRPQVEPPEKEPALAAVSPAPDRSGLFGAVRSAFVRNRIEHEHHFVEAPGGIGIVRQICEDCGYISIGVSD